MFLFALVENGERGLVGVLQGDGDKAAVGLELGDLVVVAVLGHVGPGAQLLLKPVAQLLPEAAGAVVRGERVVLLQGLHQPVVLGNHQAEVVAGARHDYPCEGRVGLG